MADMKVNADKNISCYTSWFLSLRQRPHHLVNYLLKRKCVVDVFAARPLTGRVHKMEQTPNIHSRLLAPGKMQIFPYIREWAKSYNQKVERTIINDFFLSNATIHIWQAPPSDINLQKSQPKHFIYDCIDDWEGFTNAHPDIEKWEEILCDSAAQIWVVSKHLQEKFSRHKDKVIYVPNGVDYNHFSVANAMRQVSHLHASRKKRLVYVGAIADWFDFDLVVSVSSYLKDWEMQIIGPAHGLNRATIEKRLSRSNIKMVGPCDYEILPKMLSEADVAMIPFKINDLIKGTNPIKLFEYLAAGLPVVATPMPEVLPYSEKGVVGYAETASEFANTVIDLDLNRNPARCQEIAKKSSWDERFSQAFASWGEVL